MIKKIGLLIAGMLLIGGISFASSENVDIRYKQLMFELKTQNINVEKLKKESDIRAVVFLDGSYILLIGLKNVDQVMALGYDIDGTKFGEKIYNNVDINDVIEYYGLNNKVDEVKKLN